MQLMIKGTDITLFSGDVTEIISNVLVGEPTSADGAPLSDNPGMRTYMLAIPKGDTHDWSDRIIGIWGQTFRTLGLPIQGIEKNIPLAWHKKVKVEHINISGSCTVFERGTYAPHLYASAYFYDSKGASVDKSGEKQSGSLNVRLYSDATGDKYQPKIGDIVVCGNCDFTFDTTSQATVSQSMQAFRKSYPQYAVIKECKSETYGTLPDFFITA